MGAKAKWLILAIAAIAAVAIFIARSQPGQEPPAAGVSQTEGEVAAPVEPVTNKRLDGDNANAPDAVESEGNAGEADDPHRYIPDPPVMSVELPIEPVLNGPAPQGNGQGATAPGSGDSHMSSGPGSGAAGAAGSSPVPGDPATPYAGDAPDAGLPPQVMGPGPGGEQSGTTDIPAVDLGDPVDIAVEPGADVNLGPAPEASDPGTVGPAPEDSGGQ